MIWMPREGSLCFVAPWFKWYEHTSDGNLYRFDPIVACDDPTTVHESSDSREIQYRTKFPSLNQHAQSPFLGPGNQGMGFKVESGIASRLKDNCQRREVPSRQLHFAIAWNHGCIGKKQALSSIEDMGFMAASDMMKTRWPSYLEFYTEACPNDDGQSTLELDRSLLVHIRRGVLLAQAQTTIFQLRFEKGVLEQDYWYSGKVLDDNGAIIGRVHDFSLDIWHESFPVEESYCTACEIVALSLSRLDSEREPWYLYKPWPVNLNYEYEVFKEPERRGHCEYEIFRKQKLNLTFYDVDGEPLRPVPIVNVMLIERHGPLARRIGIGSVLLTKWVAAKPEWKTILLE